MAIAGTLSARLAVRFSLGGQAGPPALFHFVGELPHGLLGGNAASCTARQGSFGRIKGGENLRPRALTLFPQGQRFLYRVLGTVKAASLNGLTDKRFLVGSQTYFHALKRRSQETLCQASLQIGRGVAALQKIPSFSKSFTTTLTTLLIAFFAEFGLKLSLMPVQTSSPSGVAVA